MILMQAERLQSLTAGILRAVGCVDEDAGYIADSLVESNLMGHDSHGVMRIPDYVKAVRSGAIQPANRPEIMNETATTALVSGNWTFGQLACRYATEVVIAKAKQSNVAVVGVVQLNHNGRLGRYVTAIAREGLIGMMTHAGHRGPQSVTPYGGKGRMLGTNPFAFAVPAGNRPPFLADFATSAVAGGKLAVARDKHEAVPPGLIVDKEGNPTTNVEDYFAGGMLLPAAGHKGYALALLAEMLGGFLMGGDLHGSASRTIADFILAVNPGSFRPADDFNAVVESRLKEIKATPPAPGFQEVLIPGEPELQMEAHRQKEGIPLPDDTWQRLLAVCTELGVEAGV